MVDAGLGMEKSVIGSETMQTMGRPPKGQRVEDTYWVGFRQLNAWFRKKRGRGIRPETVRRLIREEGFPAMEDRTIRVPGGYRLVFHLPTVDRWYEQTALVDPFRLGFDSIR
jgi:hypothetical protein